MPTVRVFVTLKPTLLDSAGRAVGDSLARLGFSEVQGARVGRIIDLELETFDEARTRAMCESLLANAVIEDFRFEVPTLKFAVLRFPGANCDEDALQALGDAGYKAEFVWHESTSLAGFDAVWVPGGFSYGDYLRCGAIASLSPVMSAVRKRAAEGLPVIGVCNGFQILCEAGLLPGALVRNADQKFVCADVWVRAENRSSVWTRGVESVLRLPIAHGEGRYTGDAEMLAELEGEGRIAFRYVDETGRVTEDANPNGSANSIAGVLSVDGNVLGLMPHPERATRARLGGTDGLCLLSGLQMVHSR